MRFTAARHIQLNAVCIANSNEFIQLRFLHILIFNDSRIYGLRFTDRLHANVFFFAMYTHGETQRFFLFFMFHKCQHPQPNAVSIYLLCFKHFCCCCYCGLLFSSKYTFPNTNMTNPTANLHTHDIISYS